MTVVLTILVALALMTAVSFADNSGAPWTIRADANPGMPVAQWYAPAAASSAPSTPWTIRADANPGMPVAQWYAPAAASSAPSIPWTIRADANPGMPVAQWYAPAAVSQGCFSC